ncbi:serine/threonine-protein kinase [Streptomyces sp. NBC_00083]|uniref:serine/threonine-protein kinase n=1 Tax=Streptomyces sp. NBC_00083 TaxID=2975647 RepID=UPI00224EDECA|nr:serine/threonine-protein kinase [Streptomyces sp. NBC_00083]MCX5383925.1 protein kinase [Streptomyces sp. NBC_00083]
MAGRFKPLTDDDPRVVGGYALRARLGAGGMGRVYLAFTPGGRALAIKVVRPDYAEDDEFRRRFRKEIDAAQRVQGLYTAPVIDADSEAGLPWLATAYVPGPSLQQAVAEHGPLPALTVFRLMAGVAEGLAAIHACALIHRDLKPANILLAEDGPRVIDFGIAHAADATSLTHTHVRIGTPAFMAPEQIRGRSASPATDVFALGNLAVFAATGRTAFGEGNPDALFYRVINEEPELGSCPDELRVIVERCLAKEPGDRPPVADIMDYARRRTQGETMSLAGSWLPAPMVTALAGYGTAPYGKSARATAESTTKTKTRPTPKTNSGPTPKATSGPTPKPKTGPTAKTKQSAAVGGAKKAGPVPKAPVRRTQPPARKGTSGSSAAGGLALIGAAAVLIIGPHNVLAWVAAHGRSANPAASATTPAYTFPAQPTPRADVNTGVLPTGTKTADPGCERAQAAIRSNNAAFDKASAASLSSLASNLDAAADAADDLAARSAIRALAADSRSMSESQASFQQAIDQKDSAQSRVYSNAYSAGFTQWKSDASTFEAKCI